MLSVALLALSVVPSAEPAPPVKEPASNPGPAVVDEWVREALAAESKRFDTRFMHGVADKEAFLRGQTERRRQFLDMMGLWPLPERTPLKATVTGTLTNGDVVIENMHFQSKPGLYVTANLYRPKSIPRGTRLPAVLYVCGHSGRGRDGNKTAFQDHGMWFGAHGYICLVVDTLQLGEIAGKHHGTYNLNRFWWQDRGYTPAGVECWNGVRAIDYLTARPDVDADRIGVTGISGGGAATTWIAAADERVKVAVPVSGMSDLQSYVGNRVINGHCDCMFMINSEAWEWTTILTLHAPKPLLFANSDNDPIFPMDGNRRIVDRLRKVYALCGADGRVDEYVSVGGHDYRPDLRIAIYRFFHKHLKGDKSAVEDTRFDKIDGPKLRAFPTDADLPKDSINDRADESFVPMVSIDHVVSTARDARGREALRSRLKAVSFRSLPTFDERSAPKEGPLPGGLVRAKDVVYFAAQEGFVSTARKHGELADRSGDAVVVVLGPQESAESAAVTWRKRLDFQGELWTIHPRGSGPLSWTRKNPPNTVERSMALLGETVDGGRVRDVLHFLHRDELRGKRPLIRLVGHGEAGVIAAYAAVFVGSPLKELVISAPPTSHRNGPHFLKVQQVLDVPIAVGLANTTGGVTLHEVADEKAFSATRTLLEDSGRPLRIGK